MFCPKCGKENSNDVKFCCFCGAPMTMPEQPQGQPIPEMPEQVQSQPAPQAETMSETPVQPVPETPLQPVPETPLQPVPETPVQGQPMSGMPVQGQPMAGMPVQGQPMSGMPVQGQPMAGAPMQGQPMAGMPVQGQPMAGMPVQGQPMPGMPVQGQPMPGMPMQGQPMPYAQSMPQIPPAQPAGKKGNGAVKVVVILIVILLLICLGVLAFMLLNKGMNNRKVQTLMNTADEYLDNSSYRLAIDTYLDVLELDPENADAISGLTDAYVEWAESYAEDGDYEAAIDLLENADSQAKAKTLEKTIEELQASVKGDWSDADLIFQSDSDTVEAALGYAFITYDDGSYLTDYSDGYYETYYGDFSTSKGLELGMLIEDYVELYDIKEGFAVWEVYSGDENEYTGFREYTGQSPAEMYDGENNNVWLDIGFCKENGEWKQLMDYEVRDVWFCDADLDDYDECVVFAVNFDSWGEVVGISLEHFAYDENWVEWQDWAD